MKFLAIILMFCCNVFANPRLEKLASSAHAFMVKNDLIGKQIEVDMPSIGVVMKWEPIDIVLHDGVELVVMNFVQRLDGELHFGDAYEVLALKDGHFMLFEEAVHVPDSIVVKIGHKKPETRQKYDGISYYVELKGPSASNALKSIYTGHMYHGFSGIAVPGGKATYDPTPNRNWRIVDGAFNLRRGNTAEVLDIQSYQLDNDFEGYFSGAVTEMSSEGVVGANVAPWGQSAAFEVVHQ